MQVVKVVALALLGIFSQCFSCARVFLCDTVSTTAATEKIVRKKIADRVFDVESGSSGLVALGGFDDHVARLLERRLEQAGDSADPRPLAIIRMQQIEGEGLTVVDDEVWYSAAGNYQGKWGAVFLEAKADASPKFVELPLAGQVRWLPLGGPAVAGLYVSDVSSSAAGVTLVTPDGVIRSWQIHHRVATARALAAAAISRTRIALAVRAEDANGGSPLVLVYLLDTLREESAPIEQRVVGADVSRLAIAAQPDGAIAVLLQGGNAGIQLARVGSPGIVIHSLAPAGDPTQIPVITAAKDGAFFAAWYTREPAGAIMAASIQQSSPASLRAVLIGRGTRTQDDTMALRLVQDGSAVTAVWLRASSLVSRSLPPGFEVVQIVREQVERLCSRDHGKVLDLLLNAWAGI